MNKKTFYSAIAILAILLLLVCSWKFVLGMAVAVVVMWVFGEEKVKKFLTELFTQTKKSVKQAHDEFKCEEEKIIIDSTSIAHSKKDGWYHIVIVANGKSWVTKPLQDQAIPQSLTAGKEVTVKTIRNLSSKGLTTKTVIIAGTDTFEVE